MVYSEEVIIKKITRHQEIDPDTMRSFLGYLKIVEMEDSPRFDRHCMILSKLSDNEFSNYLQFLSEHKN